MRKQHSGRFKSWRRIGLLSLVGLLGVTSPLANEPALARRDVRPLPARATVDVSPLLNEIRSIRWNALLAENGDNTRRLSLDKVLHETLAHNINVRQAEIAAKEADNQPSDNREAGLLNWLIPVDIGALKEAGKLNAQAKLAHVQTVKQKALLDSARLYAALSRAYVERYLVAQTIEQGLRQLESEEKRFQAGDSSSFDVTRAQMALIERYRHYLTADTAYQDASSAIANQLSLASDVSWAPDDFSWKEGEEPNVPPLHLFSEDITIEQARKTAAHNRPDLTEAALRQAALGRLVKASFGPERDKRKAELQQLEIEREKALQATAVLTEKAFHAFRLAEKNATLAQQQADLARSLVQQLRISQSAGFSSAHELMDGETELSRARASLTGAQVATNLQRIELVYEMGLLSEDIISHPPHNLP